MVGLRFSGAAELEAGRIGARLLADAGYDPRSVEGGEASGHSLTQSPTQLLTHRFWAQNRAAPRSCRRPPPYKPFLIRQVAIRLNDVLPLALPALPFQRPLFSAQP